MTESINTAFATVRRNPWPYAIIGWFVLFISGMAAWTVVAVRHDPDLVRPDYYDEEIRFQKQIERVNRTAPVKGEVSVVHDASQHAVAIRLPLAHATPTVAGRVKFYRPSNARLDFERPLVLESGAMQRVSTDGLEAGLWKVQVRWTFDGAEYYYDQALVL
jgi:hypothetical protein